MFPRRKRKSDGEQLKSWNFFGSSRADIKIVLPDTTSI